MFIENLTSAVPALDFWFAVLHGSQRQLHNAVIPTPNRHLG